MPEAGLDIDSAENRADRTIEAEEGPDEGKRIRRKDILNILNFVNFREGTIYAQFRHLKYDERLSIQARPGPCRDETLECGWLAPGVSPGRLRGYAFDSFLLSDGHDLFKVKADVARLDEQGITFKLPDFGHEKSGRKIRRQICDGVAVQLLQNGARLRGALADFSAVSCRVSLSVDDEAALRWLNPDLPVMMTLERNGALLFSGDCAVTRSDDDGEGGALVLTPAFNNIRRYRAREYRSRRQRLVPAPNVSFAHPLTGKRCYLQAADLSSCGFSTEEFFHNATLLPGLILPEITVELGNRFVMKCGGQVLYRNVESPESGDPLVKCGIVFLDMALEDQAELSALLHQTENSRTRVCNQVDMDELWRFFFGSGFIYPSKYFSLRNDKEAFKTTYEKLYRRSPAIARHFVFQDRGIIFGHMSMVRNHARTWLIHHHAADRSGYGMAGVAVLDQVGSYINEFHLHRSTRMDYVMCYYRRENRFPARVFGGVSRDLEDPKASSVDAFAYLQLEAERRACADSYQVMPASAEDLTELKRFYEAASGGLALDALNLSPRPYSEEELDRQYREGGFERKRAAFSIKRAGVLKAIAMITITDVGLNLSNLTNCVHSFVIDEKDLLHETLFSAISDICEHYEKVEIPVLLYPPSFLDSRSVAYDKQYLLWVLNMKNSDGYFKSLRNTFRRVDLGRESGRPRESR